MGDLVSVFITPKIGALIIAIWALVGLVKKIRPQIKDSEFWWNLIPYMPMIVGVVLALIPGVVDIPEGQTYIKSIGNFIVVGIACGGVATSLYGVIRRALQKFVGGKGSTKEE